MFFGHSVKIIIRLVLRIDLSENYFINNCLQRTVSKPSAVVSNRYWEGCVC